MDNICLYIKESIEIFKKNKKLLIPSTIVLVLVFYVHCMPLLSNIKNIFINKNTKNNVNLRLLNEPKKENNIVPFYNLENLTLVEGIDINLTETLYHYEFIQNISSQTYYGRWENLYFPKNKKHKFIDNYGYSDIDFYKEKNNNYLLNLLQKNSSNISAYFVLKDGFFEDLYLVGNFTFNFENYSLLSKLEKESFSIILENTSLTYRFGEFIDLGKTKTFNNTFINMTFYKGFKLFENKMFYQRKSTSHKKVSLHIISNLFNNETNETTKEFETYFELTAFGSQSYPTKLLDYSIVLTLLAIIEIIHTTKLIQKINENNQLALNLDIYTLIVHILWCAMICCCNFYLALFHNNLPLEYGMPSVAYFFLFSVFLLRATFLVWKAKNQELMYSNIRLFKKKMMNFYLIFYFVLFIHLISVKFIYTYFILTIIEFLGTWIFQIYHSAKNGTKPPMSYNYIFLVSLFKMLIPIYIKCYPNSIFDLRPNYLKVFIIDFIVFIQMIILFLQKLISPKFFVPRKYRVMEFDYYKKSDEINENDKEQECVICLENLSNLAFVEESEKTIYEGKLLKRVKKHIENFIDKYKDNTKRHKSNKPYMVTPCHHIFHSRCLEAWLEVKNECPYCRQKIPSIDI